MDLIEPHLSILPKGQRALWPELREIPNHFVLYGGTALALQLGHRNSVDFDFFSHKPIVKDQLLKKPFLKEARILRDDPETLIISVSREEERIDISFFGNLKVGRVGEPVQCEDNQLPLASLLDIAAQKMKVVQVRPQLKDYLDVVALLKTGINLEQACGATLALYQDFDYSFTLRALNYFEDGDLVKLPNDMRQILLCAAKNFRKPQLILKRSDSLCDSF